MFLIVALRCIILAGVKGIVYHMCMKSIARQCAGQEIGLFEYLRGARDLWRLIV